MISITKHLQRILGSAAQKAMPGLTEAVTVQAEKKPGIDYVSPSAMKFFNMYKKKGSFGFTSCKDMAEAIVLNIDPQENDAIENVELSIMGNPAKADPLKSGFFLNIKLKDTYLQERIRCIYCSQEVKLLEEGPPNQQPTQEVQQNVVMEDQSQQQQQQLSQAEIQQLQEETKVPVNPEPTEDKKQRVLVDFSSPNIAKNMHVGHLRSTIQGDSISRVFEFLGHEVHRVNHVGDWGTQFGMLIAELDDKHPNFLEEMPDISDLNGFYQNSKKRFDEEGDFKARAHENVVKLQSGDDHCRAGWKMLCDISRKEYDVIYQRMDIKLTEVGESFYNPMLKPMVEELQANGKAVQSDGAICVFPNGPKKTPLILQKSDGGFNYDSTDMAAIRYRANDLKVDRIVYVTDVGQEFHFKQVFKGGELCGFYNPKVCQPVHMGFGMVQQEDEQGKIGKIKTRSGESVKLVELLDEAKQRALLGFRERREQKNTKVHISQEDEEAAAEILGLSSIKYFDLKQNRIQNYVFDFDKMLDPDGNTGVYLIYQFVRVNSIIAKSAYGSEEALQKAREDPGVAFVVTNQWERELALTLVRLPEQIADAAASCNINRLTEQLYEIAVMIGKFYNKAECKVVGSDQELSRLLLMDATRKVMKVCFDLLGMKTLYRI